MIASFGRDDKALTKVLGKMVGEYKIVEGIAQGSFSFLYKSYKKKKKQSSKSYSLSLIESKSSQFNCLIENEILVFRNLETREGFPKFQGWGTFKSRKFFMLEKLSDSLEQVHSKSQNRFSLKTVLNIGLQTLKLLQNFHKAGYVHRDVKPGSFLLGIKNKKDKIYLASFSLARKYRLRDGSHIHRQTGKQLIGTPLFASIASHEGHQQGRKDDLQSLGYMLIYLLKGKLPWQGLNLESPEQRNQILLMAKKQVNLQNFCRFKKLNYEGAVFLRFFRYLRALSFSDEPNYEFLKKNFKNQSQKIDGMKIGNQQEYLWRSESKFDWLSSLTQTRIENFATLVYLH